MKIEISIEKGKDKEGKKEMMSPEQQRRHDMMKLKVARMLAKSMGRTTPNEVDTEIAEEFIQENMEYEKDK